MAEKNDKQCADVAQGMVTAIVSVVKTFDFQKESELKKARREIIKIANEQIEKIKAVAEVEIAEINEKVAAERKVINDRAAAERKIVRDRVEAELKIINEKANVELKRIDDRILQRKLAVVKGIGGVVGSTGVLDNLPFFGKSDKK